MANIQIKTSKRLADLLNKNNEKYTIYQTKMTEREYNWNVDGDALWLDCADFDYNTGKYSVLAVFFVGVGVYVAGLVAWLLWAYIVYIIYMQDDKRYAMCKIFAFCECKKKRLAMCSYFFKIS